jgi:four helix bundle protein
MTMSFEAFDRTLDLVTTLRPLLDKIGARDTDLEKQLRRAVTSIGLNLSEGAERAKGDRKRLFAYAHGSAAEVLAGLRIAATFGYVTAEQAAPAVDLAGRVKAMTYRLAR